MSGALEWLFGLPLHQIGEADSWGFRFLNLPRNAWALMGLSALLALLAWFVTRTYRLEGRGSPRVRRLLVGLRMAAMVLLLLIFLQPALVLRYDKSSPSVVALLVDDTLSMQWPDRYPEGGERDSLAKFLKVPPEQLSGAERLKRTEIVRRALTECSPCLGRLARTHQLFLVRFGAGDSYTETLAQVNLAGKRKGRAGDACPAEIAAGLGRLTAGGYETNLGRALRETLDQLEGRRLAAVVLLSDGQNTGAASAPERISAIRALLRERNAPLHAIAVGDPTPPKNILLAQLQGPGEVRKGSLLQLSACVVSRQYAGVKVQVRLLRARAGTENWEDTGVAQTLELSGGETQEEGKLQEALLTHKVEETGEFIYKAVIPPRDDEMIKSDNEAQINIKVSDQKVAVLLVSGSSNWEYQYLRNLLLRQPEQYSVTALQQNADPAFNQDASLGMKRQSLPKTREELFAYAVVLLIDPNYDVMGMDAEFLGLLADFVGKHHGGLCYIAGHKFTAANLAEGGALAKLAELLPVVLKKERGGFSAEASGPPRVLWPVQLTSAGLDHPIMRLGSSDEENQRIWSLLPGVYRALPVLRLKSLASALAAHGDAARQTIDGQPEPLIAVQYYGKGRSLCFGFDTTWRWRSSQDLQHYRRFWTNTLDFLAAGRLENKRILITTGGDVFDAGGSVSLRAEAYKRDFTPLEGKCFTVEAVHLESKQSTTHELQAAREGFFKGAFLPARTGVYEIRPKADAAGMADWSDEDVAAKRIRVRLPEDEFRKPEANFVTLRELASSPAHFRRLPQLDQLPEAIPDARTQTILEDPHTLWDTPFVLCLLAALLMAEWTIRKFVHMM